MGTPVKEFVKELRIIDENENLFDLEGEYVIPLYQRAFAWEERQLDQLVEDIIDIPDNSKYYIGSLIVSRNGNKYEVVDGQQRLTSLYLLLSCLGKKLDTTLTFECRDKSNYTLRRVHELLDEKRSDYDNEGIENGIHQGIKILKEKIAKYNKDSILDKLSRVIIYRIEVPKNTDLNRYFEIMNTRGEQLEQHDILKAYLMEFLDKDSDKAAFAKIWEACSDMTGYVQMHLDKSSRECIFGEKWRSLPSGDWNDYREISKNISEEGNGSLISDITQKYYKVSYDDVVDDDNNRIRFESVIEFPYFLLHVLRVFVAIYAIKDCDNNEILNNLLDDKKLLSNFKDVIKNGIYRGKTIDGKSFSRKFIICLLRSRYLFDKYVLKREFANDNSDGEWSLKELNVSGQQANKKPYYRNTLFVKKHEQNQNEKTKNRTETNIMLQSALRVSYTSPKVMHWITDLMIWLSENNCKNLDDDIINYSQEIESIAQNAVIEQFFKKAQDDNYAMGVDTPHIVFNYLDYLLWKNNKTKYSDFVFEFRNSVEHWYPQHPSEGSFDSWDDGKDQFGNLCIIQRNVNARFSNMAPEAKKSTFVKKIAEGSLKLRIMSELTNNIGNENKTASACWKDEACKRHGQEMIKLLKEACFGG